MNLEKNIIQRVALGDIIRRTARKYPDKVALIERIGNKRKSITYQALNQLTNKFAHAIREMGLIKGDRVATICANSLDFVISIFGLYKAGITWVPINPGISVQDMIYILEQTGAQTLIIDKEFYEVFYDQIKKSVNLNQVILLSEENDILDDNVVCFDKFLKEFPDYDIEDIEIWERDICQIMYTSGTTARPKGALISHLAVFIASLNNIIEVEIFHDSVLSCILPLFHCAQHTFTTSAFQIGATVVILRGIDVDLLLEAIDNEKITWLFALPVVYRQLLDHPKRSNYDLSSLKYCLYAMTPMDKRTLSRLIEELGVKAALGTGQTEAYPSTNNFKPKWQLLKEGNYWGESATTVETAIMDDFGNLLPPGEIGEIVWRGPIIMEGYLNNEEATKESRKYGWHHSGDLGYFDEDGLLVFVDRKKDMIKTGGENVPSIKVEQVILEDPRIAECAVVGLSHPKWIEAVTAFVVPKENADISEQDVIELCKKKLGKFEVPKTVVFVNELPKTRTGKIQKYILKDNYKTLYTKDLHTK